VRELILKSLATRIDAKVVEALLSSYETLVTKFQKGDLEGCLGVAGKFVEHTLRAAEYIRTGTAPTEIKAPQQTVKELEKDQKLPEGLRILIPRIAHAMIYDMRSKRGAIHVKEIDPRQIDASLTVQAASWVLAEFIRLYHVSDEAAVTREMATLMRPHIPFIEQFGEESVVTRAVPCDVELLLLLARGGQDGLDRRTIGQASKYPPSTVTQSLQRMEKARHVHRTRQGAFHITGPGEKYLLNYLAEQGT
jgi:hypothetical protein